MSISPELLQTARNVSASLEEFQKTLLALNDEPNVAEPIQTPPAVAAGIGDGVTAEPARPAVRRLITPGQMFALRRELRTKSNEELQLMFAEQAAQKDTGVPLEMWLNRSGFSAQERFGGIHGQVDPDISRAIDTSSASALIRQDLEPILYELYVREFPGFERMRKEPANGLTHTWNRITAYGDAQFMGELGTVTDDKQTYDRQTTNVAILATRRGVSLKSKFAVIAGGMSYNPEQLELEGGLRAMAHKMQYQIFNGHSSDSGGTASNELGLYDANAFTGLRSILNTARATNVDPETAPTTTGNMRRAINQAVIQILQQGGRPTIIWGNPFTKEQFDNQQDQNVRYNDTFVNVAVGVVTNVVNTAAGPLPIAIVPGDGIGDYLKDSNSLGNDNSVSDGASVRDLFVLDEKTITLPYLGTDGPTVLDIPIGISGQLTHLYIVFGMWGLAVKAPTFSNKVRVKRSAFDT